MKVFSHEAILPNPITRTELYCLFIETVALKNEPTYLEERDAALLGIAELYAGGFNEQKYFEFPAYSAARQFACAARIVFRNCEVLFYFNSNHARQYAFRAGRFYTEGTDFDDQAENLDQQFDQTASSPL